MEGFRQKIRDALAACMEGIGEDMTPESLAAGVRKAIEIVRAVPVDSVPSEVREDFQYVIDLSAEPALDFDTIGSRIAFIYAFLEGLIEDDEGEIEDVGGNAENPS